MLTDRQTRMTKLVVAFRKFAKALKNRPLAAIELRTHNLVAYSVWTVPKICLIFHCYIFVTVKHI
jgi:hypothetical protein